MIRFIYFLILFLLFSLSWSNFNKIPLSIVQSLSLGYEDNFMRFSDIEMDSYYNEIYTDNDYLGDSKYYDSAIISPSLQLTFKPKIKGYKTNIVLKGKFNEYTSSNHKSYFNFYTRFELRLKSYN